KHVERKGLAGALPADHVVCLWDDDVTTPPPTAALDLATKGLEVAQLLAAQTRAPRVWWMTRGAQAVEPGERPWIAGSCLWGLGRTLREEHPELGCSLVDLPPGEGADLAAFAELAIADAEQETAWRAGRRLSARLERAPGAPQGDGGTRALRTDGT